MEKDLVGGTGLAYGGAQLRESLDVWDLAPLAETLTVIVKVCEDLRVKCPVFWPNGPIIPLILRPYHDTEENKSLGF